VVVGSRSFSRLVTVRVLGLLFGLAVSALSANFASAQSGHEILDTPSIPSLGLTSEQPARSPGESTGEPGELTTLPSEQGESLQERNSPSASQLPTSLDAAVSELRDASEVPLVKPSDPFLGNTETTLFDVYLGDKFKGAVLADYTNEWLEISDSEVVLEQLSELRDTKRLLPLLAGKIAKSRSVDGVGSITYDLNGFRIILSLAETFMVPTNLNLERIAPDPDLGLSLQQRVGLTAGGTLDSSLNTAFNHRSIASRGGYFAVIDGAVVSDKPYELTEAKGGGIFGDYRASAGLLQTTGNSFAPSLQFLGVSAETAQDLFLDQDLIRGSRFEVFVPSRSRVEFYRDGRIIAAQSLDFGLREIDTTQFPQGSYDVDIVITDSFGVVTRERKFFTKSGLLASTNRPIFFLQVGSIRDNVDVLDTAVYQTGVRWRAADIFDLGGSVYGSEKLTIGTVETNLLYRDVRFSASYVGSSENDRGVSGSLGASVLGISANLNVSETLNGGQREEALPQPDPNDPFAPIFSLNSRRRELVFQDRTSHYASVYRAFGPVEFRFAGEKNSGGGAPERKRYGPTVEWRVLNDSKSSLRIQASRFQTDDEPISSVGALYTYRIAKEWALSAQIVERKQDIGRETLFLVGINYDAKRFGSVGTRAAYRNEVLNRRPDTGDSVLSVANQIDIDRTGDYLQTVGFLRDTRTETDQNTSIGGSATGSFLLDSDGKLAFGRPVSQEAVFIAEVPNGDAESEFEVLLNNQVRGTVRAGGRSIIGVTPYKKYTIKIRPVLGDTLVEYDSKVTTSTFFPGNVIRRVFEVERVYIVLGRIVDESGRPIPNQRIKGPREYTVADENGNFQAEISGKEVLRIENKQRACTLVLGIAEVPEYLAQVGDVVCKSELSS
jgi:hypothetical protein